MSWLVRLFALAFALLVVLLSALAVAGVLGFAVPAFDLVNNFQALLFPALLAAFVVVVWRSPRQWWGKLLTAIVATGFLSSATIAVPELVGGLMRHSAAPSDDRPVYRLMTHNLFGLNADMDEIAAAVFAQDPDIVTFQEFFRDQGATLRPLLAERYPHSVRCISGDRAFLAIFAKEPFALQEEGACQAGPRQERTGRLLARFAGKDGRGFSVMNTHLDWPAPLGRKREQFNLLAQAVRQVEGPMLLAGDFNATPWSYAFRDFVGAAELTRHTRNLPTFPALIYVLDWSDTLPFLPIDHVLSRNGVAVHRVARGEAASSDHYAVVVDFSITTP